MRTRSAILALILGLPAFALADGIYKWVDEDGVVHFGSQPPQEKQVEVVKAPKSERYKKWQQEQNALEAGRKLETAANTEEVKEQAKAPVTAEKSAINKAEMAARAQRCESAQRRLQELQSHARVREVDASGNYRVLPEEERQQRIQQAQQILQTSC
ncbi:DUF4124 domain-containing protein [uncultured Microbulbifer sp.]|uniref:DUF4124 domain-containing protein n=1 Tax=uncultured Microbulbifer sp. TaxID=348147 RepID=UPI0025D2F8C3|nr:DUF4124 domain-containing protein [uncultured Microbulbifer sp.]